MIDTVKGYIHDIGKNIVRVILENFGFEVIYLGRDVNPERVVDVTLESGAKFVALSALMTTTLSAMEETVKLLREKCPDTKIMVGGAVLNEEYAKEIGADIYAPDAMAAVRAAQSVFLK